MVGGSEPDGGGVGAGKVGEGGGMRHVGGACLEPPTGEDLAKLPQGSVIRVVWGDHVVAG